MPPEVHPAIAAKIEQLLERAKDLTTSQQQNLDILSKTIDLKDVFGLKMRVEEVVNATMKLQWVAAQLVAFKDIPYQMAASEMTMPKKRSSQSMPAVKLPEKKDDR